MKMTRARLAVAAALLAGLALQGLAQEANHGPWSLIPVPGTWEERSDGRFADYDGFAWYRCRVKIPASWIKQELQLRIEKIDNLHEAFINGVKVGGAGSLPPDYESGLDASNSYVLPAESLKPDAYNVVAIRVYDREGRGGFKGTAPALVNGDQAVFLAGRWQFRTGDDQSWSVIEDTVPNAAMFSKIVSTDSLASLAEAGDGAGPLSPARALETLQVPDDLTIEQVLAEPDVAQPVFLNFDERGRMWVVNYKQYPYPAGVKMVSRDEYWRAVYDKTPQPPPNHVRGLDTITIHEDTDGDGTYDLHKRFLDGLNIATACERGRGGVWVLNPPYLLFYPDEDGDDVPDGDPTVHLQGFGLEDTHSAANSLRWGPDGWLYAAQGSTVSGNITRPGDEKQIVHSMGQLIWRYHPEARQYEIFAEGGGNAFSCEFDAQGRVFSGHNGGNTRGFHYVQGGYSRKGFTKHGPLSNPYAFGFFEAMPHHDVPRFTHNFVIYEGGSLPEAYRGRLFGVEPLQGRVVMSDVARNTSSFKTQDVGHPVTSSDQRFRPVEIKAGPDGALYVADMYEPLISHRQHFEGQIDKQNGRIYRLRAKDAPPLEPFDLGSKTSDELIDVLGHPNKWFRQTALRLLADRRDASLVPKLRTLIAEQTGQLALEALWALNLSGGFDEAVALQLLRHADPHVRLWTVRLLCDDRQISAEAAAQLADISKSEPYVEVRSQLASSARRLPVKQALAIVANLLGHDEDVDDVHVPLLLWWAIEAQAAASPQDVVELFRRPDLWDRPLVAQTVASRLMKRFAMSGSRGDLIVCARLFEIAPNQAADDRLMQGFEEAFKGRPLSGLPQQLVTALNRAGGGSLALRVRQGDPAAVKEALNTLKQPTGNTAELIEYVQTFGEVRQPAAIPVLLELLKDTDSEPLQSAVLTALQSYEDAAIARTVLGLYASFSDDVRSVSQTLLVSRAAWTRLFLEAIDGGSIAAETVPLDVVRKMTIHSGDDVTALISKHWKNVDGASTAEMKQVIERFSQTLAGGSGDPYHGKELYAKTCAKCHLLFGQGGRIGPDLTTYKRDDSLNILINVVNPSAEIREGFETFLVVTEDGRMASGFLFDQDNRVVVLRGTDGQNITLARDRIDEMLPQRKSLMPEGLLNELNEQDVRDLFAYLRTSQPLNN